MMNKMNGVSDNQMSHGPVLISFSVSGLVFFSTAPLLFNPGMSHSAPTSLHPPDPKLTQGWMGDGVLPMICGRTISNQTENLSLSRARFPRSPAKISCLSRSADLPSK